MDAMSEIVKELAHIRYLVKAAPAIHSQLEDVQARIDAASAEVSAQHQNLATPAPDFHAGGTHQLQSGYSPVQSKWSQQRFATGDPTDPGGYWAPRTTNVEWCEMSYVHSYYIAEYFNTASSLVMIFISLAFIYLWWSKFRHIKCGLHLGLALTLISVGSAVFHATQTWPAEMLDEVAMLVFVMTVISAQAGFHPLTTKYADTFYAALQGCLLSAVIVYFTTHIYLVFVATFLVLTVFAVYIQATCYPHVRVDVPTLRRGSVIMLTGWGFWLIERGACPHKGHWIAHLHSVWHLMTVSAGFLFGLHILRVHDQMGRSHEEAKKKK